MTIFLAENIKRLRRERELTQEALAEYLGVTFQSVSNWERGESYPDITLLPEIAQFFKVSTDDLLGMGKAEAQKKINEYLGLYENMRIKDTHLVFEQFSQAVKDFPSDFRIAVRYMELLMCEKTTDDATELEKISRDIYSIYENIQNHCTDDSIRMWAKRLICQHLHTKAHYTGNNDYQLQTEKIIAEMPELTDTRDYLSTMLITDIKKHYEACSRAIEGCLFLTDNAVSHLCYYDDAFSAEYKIEAVKKMITIFNIIYTDGNYGKNWLNMIYNYGHLVHLYAEINDTENAIESLRLCAETARKYDSLPEITERSCQFFENTEYKKIQRGKTMCQRMKYLITEKYPLSDEFRENKEFREIMQLFED